MPLANYILVGRRCRTHQTIKVTLVGPLGTWAHAAACRGPWSNSRRRRFRSRALLFHNGALMFALGKQSSRRWRRRRRPRNRIQRTQPKPVPSGPACDLFVAAIICRPKQQIKGQAPNCLLGFPMLAVFAHCRRRQAGRPSLCRLSSLSLVHRPR